MGVPVVQTLHNYRLFCARADFFRNGHVCEDCLGKMVPWPGIVHGCYQGSRAETAVVASMLTVHRWLRTWQDQVNVYIALTDFSRQKFVQAGLPAEKIVVKPNFVHPDPGMREGASDYAIFVGRFSPEKKILTLLKAWRKLKGIRLKIVGGGPEIGKIQRFIREYQLDSVELFKWLPREEVWALIKNARFLIFSSEWYESFGLIIAEAFACGVPVISSRLGVMTEMVEEGRTGLFYTPGQPEDLADKVRWAMDHPDALWHMGENARRVYEAKYTPERNYKILLDIYNSALAIQESTLCRSGKSGQALSGN
jgi:glycosyltransferase involved in cell wall biosynthesis